MGQQAQPEMIFGVFIEWFSLGCLILIKGD
jgi:hypothetical protein